MSTVENISDALIIWATAVCPEFQGAYDYAAERKTAPLPDIATEITSVSISDVSDDRFHLFSGIQQFSLKVFEFNVLVMVNPDPPETAATELSGLVDRLMDALVSDPTLGGALSSYLALASARVSASYNPPFVQFDDGTKGRLATLSINIAAPKAG